VAKLLIFRGEALLDERELTEKTLRIGRSAQNDLVLEDPGKGVSREHAEIRFEDGCYVLVDRESQNGIWVSGTRVPSVVLDPDVSAAVGPYRLMLKAPVPVPVGQAAGPDTAPYLPPPPDPSAAPLVLDDVAPPPKKTPTPPPAPPPPARGVPVRPPQQGHHWYADPRVLGGAVAVVLIAVSAVVWYKVMHKPAPAVWDPAVAQALVASGKCQEALETQINPALRNDPNNRQALALRDGCNPPAPPPPSDATSSIPPAPTAADRLNEAETLLAANIATDCQRALDTINAVLAEDANNARAKDLSSKASVCINPPPRQSQTPSGDKPAVAISPAQGGLEVIQGETDKAYKARIDAMKKRYDDAVAVLASQKYVQAMRLLDEIVSDVPSGYRELAKLRGEARAAIKAEARSILDAAQAADKANEFDAAINGYRRAHDMDPSIQVDAQIQRLNGRKLEIGTDRCNKGKMEYAFGNGAGAIPLLQDAVKLLPPSDPCYGEARRLLQQLLGK
jgi:tetratricopeptide (TPR) repeat protein